MWREIETAPKDGTEVLLHVPGRKPDVGSWFVVGDRGWWTIHAVCVAPTHWRPLPEPPEVKRG